MAEVEVELQGGIKVKLPEEQATAYTAARTKDKAERETLAAAAGAAKAEKDQEATRRQKAEDDKNALEAAKKGEIDEVRKILTAESTAKITKLSTKYRDQALAAVLGSSQALLRLPNETDQRALVNDIVTQLASSCRFDLDSDTLQVTGPDGRPAMGSDGKPVAVDAFIGSFLEARPYLRQPTKTPGSGGDGGGKTTTTKTIRLSEYNAAQMGTLGEGQALSKQIAAGSLKVIDG